MTEVQNEPLLRTPQETVVTMRSDDGRRGNKKALIVAGVTVLACLLIAGQALAAYFILNQRSRLGDLEQTSDTIKKQLLQQPHGSSGSKMMPIPVNSMPMMMNSLTMDDDEKDPSFGQKQGPSEMATSSFGELREE